MNKLKTAFIAFAKSTKVKTFIWQTINGFVLLLIAFATQVQPDIIDPVGIAIFSAALATLNFLTKFINNTYIK